MHRKVSTWTDGKTHNVAVAVFNKSSLPVSAFWLDYNGERQHYSTLEPNDTWTTDTYNTHYWELVAIDESFCAQFRGDAGWVHVFEDGRLEFLQLPKPVYDHPVWGRYGMRGASCGIHIAAFDCVDERAVRLAAMLMYRMFEHTPAGIMKRLREAGCKLAIIGRNQDTTDIPEHFFLKLKSTGRDIDGTTRGLGATSAIPTASCGEENVLMEDDSHYPEENILIHEMAHAVMDLGLDDAQRDRIRHQYECARSAGRYPEDCYMMENADEYWAEGAQSWFDATVRCDVNGGVNTRQLVKEHDPGLARLLMEVYGDGPWRYPQDSPGTFGAAKDKSSRRIPDGQRVAVAALSAAAAAAASSSAPPTGASQHAPLQAPGSSAPLPVESMSRSFPRAQANARSVPQVTFWDPAGSCGGDAGQGSAFQWLRQCFGSTRRPAAAIKHV